MTREYICTGCWHPCEVGASLEVYPPIDLSRCCSVPVTLTPESYRSVVIETDRLKQENTRLEAVVSELRAEVARRAEHIADMERDDRHRRWGVRDWYL